MPTFKELLQRTTEANHKKLVLQHLIEYLDVTFKPVAGNEKPLKMLRTVDGVVVPQAAFESVIQDMLVSSTACDAVITEVDNASLQPQSTQPQPAVITQEQPSEPGNPGEPAPVPVPIAGDPADADPAASSAGGRRRRSPAASGQ
jgi:hypothetical protein